MSAASSPSNKVNASKPAESKDTEKFAVFYRQTIPRLISFLRIRGASAEDAADCAQEAMIHAFFQWGAIFYPDAWTRQVAWRNYIRRVAQSEHRVAEADELSTALAQPDVDIDEFEQIHLFLELLNRLPLRQRQVLASTFDGATPTEIAQELGISAEAARSNLKKARRALASYLKTEANE